MDAAGITEDHRDRFVDRGDGILVLIHASDAVPKPLLLSKVISDLSLLVHRHGVEKPDERFQLRAVVHAGDVHYDSNGCFGQALDLAFRLLDSPKLKRCLRNTSRPVVMAISEDIYRAVVQQGYPGIDGDAFGQQVTVQLGARRHRGRIQAPAAG